VEDEERLIYGNRGEDEEPKSQESELDKKLEAELNQKADKNDN
jgi:hypothetical protein